MKKKLFTVMIMIIMAISLYGCGQSPEETDSVAEPESQIDYQLVQQEMSNFVCEAPYYVYDGWIYTMSFPEDGGLGILSKLRTDGTEYSVLTEKGAPYFIYVDGEFIYSILHTDDSAKAYRCRLGGDDLEQLTEDDIWYLQVVEDYLYYCKENWETGETTGLYRCNKDGTNEEMVLEKEAYYTYVIDDIIYYQDDNDGETIHQYNLKTKEDKKITEGLSYSFIITEKYGYYIKNDKSAIDSDFVGNIVRINLETEEEKILYEGADTGGIVVKDNNIYFTNANDENRIYSIGTDGEGIKLITQDTNCTRLAVFGDNLLYTDFDSNKEYIDGVYICNLDGSNKVKISK